MNPNRIAALGGLCMLGFSLAMTPAVAVSADATQSDADKAALFKAAGAVIDTVRNLNGDARPEAVVSDGGTYCYGHAGTGFQLLSKQASGSWKVMTSNSGMPEFLKTKGKDGWPDISVGGPGFCFPVEHWNGKTYELNRFEYEGKRCKPPR